MRSPYLIDGFKFDLRIYVLITNIDPLKIFVLKDGMAWFCTEKWDIKNGTNYDNLQMHLTNFAVNKDSSNYKEGEGDHGDGGSKWSMMSVLKQMEEQDGVDIIKL
jgi:hypothetical protein